MMHTSISDFAAEGLEALEGLRLEHQRMTRLVEIADKVSNCGSCQS